jgi:hypothetical protein
MSIVNGCYLKLVFPNKVTKIRGFLTMELQHGS